MKFVPPDNRNATFVWRLTLALAIAALVPLLLYGSAPSWWSQRDVLVEDQAADDYAPVNQGQLKNIAKAAVAEMDAKLTGGAGDELHSLIGSWSSSNSTTNDFAPVNLGQLKNLARLFYDRLASAGIVDHYPWQSSLNSPDDFAVANIGQVKNLFSFEIPGANVLDDPLGDRLAAGQDSANLALEAHVIWIWADHLNDGDPLGYPRRINGVPSIRAVSAGERHLVALGSDGTVWTWGENANGQLGDGTTDSRSSPTRLVSLANITSVKAGGLHTLARQDDGTVLAWGANYYGQLGTGDTTAAVTPTLVTGLNDVRKIAAGYHRSVALKNDGTVWIWGYDHFAWQTEQGIFNSTPVVVPDLTDVVDIAAGYEHNVAVKADGTVWAWGSNYANQIGDGSPSWQSHDVPVQVANLVNIIKVASSYDHTLALANDGTVWAWGYNFFGQLGDGMVEARQTPVRVSGLTDVVAIATAYSYSLAMKADGTVWAWGGGALGTLPGSNKRLPQLVGLGLLDTNHNGMDDRWELLVLGDLDQSPGDDFDGDGLTNLQEFQRGTDPFDYYNGRPPTIRIIGGDQQQGDPDTFAADALAVQVVAVNGNPLANAPVEFILTQGSGQFAFSKGGPGAGTFLRMRTDANGHASVFYHFPALADNVSVITVAAGGTNIPASVLFTVKTSNPPPPMAASDVTATKNPNGTVTLTWKDNSNNEQRFVIETQNPDGTWQAIGVAQPNATSFTTSKVASNYRVRPERYGASAPAQETNPVPIRYAIIDLGPDTSPIRITNTGYVLCQPTKQGKPQRRWYQGQFQDLSGGDDNAFVGTRDIDEAGTVVGSVIRYQVGVPSPPIGSAAQYFGTFAWYRRPEYGHRVAARWDAGSNAAMELGAPTFDFKIIHTSGTATYSGTVTNALAWTIDSSSGAVFGTAIVSYQEEAAHIDPAGNPVETRWGTIYSGFDFNSGTALGNQTLLLQPGGFIVQGDPFYIHKARNGMTIGGDSESPASARYLNGLLVDFRPINLNSVGNALILTIGSQPKYQIYETNTGARTDLAAAASFAFTPAAHPAALNQRTINMPDSSGASTEKTSPQIVGFFGTDFASTGATIWEEDPKTGQYVMQYLNLMIPQNSGWNLRYATDINDTGAIIGTGTYIDPSNPQAQGQTRGFLLIPIQLTVDANRDEEMSFTDSSIGDKDRTSADRPYRFWTNEDQDAVSGTNDSDEITPPQIRDNQDEKIQSVRDCEDLARLWLNLSGLTESFKSGAIKAVVKFRDVKAGNPSIRLFRAVENGGRQYVSDEAWGSLQASPPFDQALPGANGPGIASSTSAVYIDKQFWSGLSESDPVINLLFEGVDEGKGALYVELLKDGKKVGEVPGVWLDIKSVKKMYERVKAQPENIVAPYAALDAFSGPVNHIDDPDGHPFEKPWDETNQCVMFVHGWNVTYNDYIGTSNTLFKRLWHQGFKGHLGAFRWDTLTQENFITGEYNRSENRAFSYGPALKAWALSLSAQYTVSVIAHSMGNIVAGEALREGMPVRNYLLLEAAIPMACYDSNTVPLAPLVTKEQSYPTPAYHIDPFSHELTLGYGNYLSNVAGTLTNFYNPDDWGLVTGKVFTKNTNWEANQEDYKPDGAVRFVIHAGSWSYHYDPSGHPLNQRARVVSATTRFVTDSAEMKAFVARSRTKAVGAMANNSAVFNESVNLKSQFGFTDSRADHSGQFTRPIQKVDGLFKKLRETLEQ